ncbi:MAG: hypothetical protein KF805_09370 [Phycisphaeraceae bacterium]|nr:hypothetical protein [Phycisphaeraceae bacterium]
MPDQIPFPPHEELTPLARERRDAMLPALLSEVRRVRRRRTATRIASVGGACALAFGVLALALLRTSPLATSQPLAKVPTLPTLDTPHSESQTVHIEIVQSSPDVLERLSLRAPSLVQVEYINTDQALALLESTGDRYGIIEIAGRVEFQLIAQR